MNRAAEQLFGYSKRELLGRTVEMLVTERFRYELRRGIARRASTLNNPSVSSEKPLQVSVLEQSGEEFQVELRLDPIPTRISGEHLVLAIFRDVTPHRATNRERPQFERASVVEANANERRFALLARASEILASSFDYRATLAELAHLAVPELADWYAVHIVEPDSLQLVVIRHRDSTKVELARTLWTKLILDGRTSGSLPDVVANMEPRLYSSLLEARQTEGSLLRQEDATFRRLGLVSAALVPMRARGRAIGVLSLATAESGRQFNAGDLSLFEDLAQRCAIAIDQARLYEEARRAIELRNELLSSVSHDLRNPLTTIKGMTQMLERSAARRLEDADWLINGLRRINSSVSRMVILLNDVTDLTRLEIGQPLELERETCDLVHLTEKVVGDAQRTAEYYDIRLKTPLESLIVNCDIPRLERVLVNLLDNALKNSQPGSLIDVSVDRDPSQPVVGVIRVRDYGIGIPESDLPHVFETFYWTSSAERSAGGTRVGLASAKRLIELQGGEISVESREGRGSTFTVRLPLVPE